MALATRYLSAAAFLGCFVFTLTAEAELVAHWAFDGDFSQSDPGGANIQSATGATFVPGLVGDAVQLSGSGSYLELGTNSSPSIVGPGPSGLQFTVSMFFKSMSEQTQALISFDDDGVWARRAAIYTDPNGIRAAFTTTGGSFDTAKTGVDQSYAGEWQHVAMTFVTNNGSGMSEVGLYVNGVKVDSDTAIIGDSAVMDSGEIGRYHSVPHPTDPLGLVQNGSNFAGLLDEIQIWNSVLSDGEIQAIYTAAIPEPSALLFGAFTAMLVTRGGVLRRRGA